MKKISTLVMIAMMVVFSPIVLAKNETTWGGTGAIVAKPMVSPTSGAGIANQNQIKTQNEGEDQQLMINTTEEEEAGDSTISAAMRSVVAQEKMSEVAKGVEEILTTKSLKGGIGDRVRLIAQEQKQSQDQVGENIAKVEKRSVFLKALIGSDYGALKNLKVQITQNELRIQELTKLKNQLINSGDIAMVQETIDALVQQNVSLQEMINAENRLGSVFGWLIKLLTK